MTQGKVAIVDAEDFERLSKYKWHFNKLAGESTKGYACRTSLRAAGKRHRIFMHWEVTGYKWVDHINRDGLDNRKENLRPANNSKNQQNRGVQKNNTSGHKGVSFKKSRNRFRSQIRLDGKFIFLGYFKTAEEASKAYIEAAKKLYGGFARWK